MSQLYQVAIILSEQIKRMTSTCFWASAAGLGGFLLSAFVALDYSFITDSLNFKGSILPLSCSIAVDCAVRVIFKLFFTASKKQT